MITGIELLRSHVAWRPLKTPDLESGLRVSGFRCLGSGLGFRGLGLGIGVQGPGV